jgi:hypothetical protein
MAEEKKYSCAPIYEIKVKGHLGEQWADWFEDLTFTQEGDGTTTLYGLVADQAALRGVLNVLEIWACRSSQFNA